MNAFRSAIAPGEGRPQRYGPEELFSAIDGTRAARFGAFVNANPVRSVLGLAAFGVLLPLSMVLPQAGAATNFWLDTSPHIAVIGLLMGWLFFPTRFSWLPFLIYLASLAASILVRVAVEPGYIPSGPHGFYVISVMALANAAAVGLAVLLGRLAYRKVLAAGFGYRADLALILGSLLGFGVIGTLANLITLAMFVPPFAFMAGPADPDFTLASIMVLRLGRLAAASGLFLLVLLEPLGRKQLVWMGQGLVLGGVMSLLYTAGLTLHPTIDPLIPLLVAAPILRPHATTILSVSSLVVYDLLSQAFSGFETIESHPQHVLEMLSGLGFGFLLLSIIVRFWTVSDLARSRAALGRLKRVHDIARVGYFVVDPDRRVVHTDPIGAVIVGTATVFDVGDFLARVAPQDLPAITEAMADRTSASRHFSFHLNPGDIWRDDQDGRCITVYLWYEDVRNRGRLAYGAVLDMTEEDQREASLRLALSKLSEQQDQQTQLFSIVSHELRTPASIISMLLEEMDAHRDWDAIGPKVHNVTRQLLSVLADMRQAVRPDQNLPVTLEVVSPQEKLERLRNTFSLLAERSGISIVIDAPPSPVSPRMTDRTRMTQAMSNLIKNAILHSQAKTIFLSYREERDGAQVMGVWTVADDGRGISAETRSTLFQPFKRGMRRGTRQADGSGLGLFVVKTAMELLGGGVTCADRPGGGTVFDLRVPMHDVVQPRAAGDHEAKARQSAGAVVLTGKSLLIAEDNDIIADLLKARLTPCFARVTVVPDGKAAVALQSADPHDVILTDLFMPEMGGDDLTRTLRASGCTGPILGMTAASIGEERSSFEAAGTDAVITKPVRTDAFLSALTEIFERTA